jgi:2-haloalkanoic acid dehalogenase type II
MRLRDFGVLTFDCYGTLIDWESGLLAALAPWRRREKIEASDREVLEAFAVFEARQQAETPALLYPEVLANVMQALGKRLGGAVSDADARAFGRSVADWPAFPDSADALAYLKRHYKLVVLSNVDRDSFRASNTRLDVEFDAVYTAQDIGSYKPSPANFDYLLARLGEQGIDRGRILHTAQSLFHDHIPAKAAGLATCWIDRQQGKKGHGATTPPGQPVTPDFRYKTLGDMAAAHRGEG